MPDLDLTGLRPAAAATIKPFLDEMLASHQENVHSIHVTGTAVTDDFNDSFSDVNSIIVLKQMDVKFLESLAPLGKKHGKNRVAAPLIMTPHYIQNSLDVFPVEFLNFKLVHATVFGEDILREMEIGRNDLRLQCEREIKTKLIWLRQGYLSSRGDRKALAEGFLHSITGYIPLFRGIIVLFEREAPVRHGEVITALSEAVNLNTDVYARVLKKRHEKMDLSIEELNTLFEDYYDATDKIRTVIDDLQV